MTSTKVLDYFASLVADEHGIPLTETALSIAQDAYPDLDLQAELAALDMLAVRLKRRIADGTPAEVMENQAVIDAYLGVAH